MSSQAGTAASPRAADAIDGVRNRLNNQIRRIDEMTSRAHEMVDRIIGQAPTPTPSGRIEGASSLGMPPLMSGIDSLESAIDRLQNAVDRLHA